jgi:hypothetical protein
MMYSSLISLSLPLFFLRSLFLSLITSRKLTFGFIVVPLFEVIESIDLLDDVVNRSRSLMV